MRYHKRLASMAFMLLALGFVTHNVHAAVIFDNARSSGAESTVLGWNSKTVISNNGADKRHELHVKQINFKDADGSFKPIDVSLKNSPSGGWEVTSSTFIARFPARSSGLAVMINNNRYDTRTLKDISASPASQTIQAIGVNDVAGVKMFGDVGNGEQEYVLYPGAYADADLIFLVWHGRVPRLQKLIRFTSEPATDRDFQFRFAYPDRDVNFKSASITWNKLADLKGLRHGLTITDSVASARGFGQKEYRIWDSSTPDRNSQLIKVDISAMGRNAYILTKHIPLSYFTTGKPKVFPVYTDTTTTVYPDPDTETSSVDGIVVRNQGSSESFASNRTGAGTSADASTDTAEGGLLYSQSTPYTHLYRGVFLFDTSSVSSTETISAATLSFKGALGLDNYTQSASIVKTTPASNTALVASDFNIANWDMTQQASDIALSALSGSNYNDFTLNATGIGNIGQGVGGMAKFGTVLSGDRTNTDPGASTGAYSVWNIIKAEHAGTGSDPKLVIESDYVPVVTSTIAFDNATSDIPETEISSVTFSHAVSATGSNRILFVGVETWTDSITGVTYNGSALTLIGKETESYNDSYAYLYYLVAPATGTHDVVVSAVNANHFIGVTAVSYTGASQTGVPDASATSNGQASSNVYSQSLTPVADNSWVVMMGDDSQGLADAAGSSSTLRGTTLRGAGMFVDSNGPVTPAGSKTLSVHGGATDRWSVVIASFKP